MEEMNLGELFYGKRCVIRTTNSGVHYAIVDKFDPRHNHVLLSRSRRIWRWEGAFTITELTVNGLKATSRLSIEKFKPCLYTEVIEIIPCDDKAIEVIDSIPAFEPEKED